MKAQKKPIILVSSTVYGIEELLDRIYSLLTTFGYEVWMSHKGTISVRSNKSNFDNCIRAVENCDLFLGIITPQYGSGLDGDGLSICHKEIRKAIELNKPRWLLAHDHLVFARNLLRHLGYDDKTKRDQLTLKKNQILSDLRVIDMYEEAIVHQKPLDDRRGNWVQAFQTDEDALLFATAQFSRFQEVEEFIRENLRDSARVLKNLGGKGEPQ